MVYRPLSVLLLPSLALGASLKAYKNSQCNEPLEIKSEGKVIPNGELTADTSITNWNASTGPAGTWYNKMTFENATTGGSVDGTGANNVYWKTPDMDPGCTLVLMVQTHGPDEGWKTLTPLPGEVALITQDEGCYYSSLNNYEGLITSFCCGSGDCASVHMGAQLFVKRDLSTRAPLSNAAAASRTVRSADEIEWAPAEADPSKFNGYKPSLHEKRGLWDSIKNFFTGDDEEEVTTPEMPEEAPKPDEEPEPEPEGPKCTVVGEPKKVGVTTGQQKIVTDPQSCDTGPGTCSHTVSVSFQASTALSHSKSESWTVTGGLSVGVSAGISFITEGSVDTTVSSSLAKAWSEDTGTTITTGWSNSTAQTIAQQVGTHAMLTFTPFYECWKGDASCGEDEDGNEIIIEGMDFCQPVLKNGDQVNGRYSMVYM